MKMTILDSLDSIAKSKQRDSMWIDLCRIRIRPKLLKELRCNRYTIQGSDSDLVIYAEIHDSMVACFQFDIIKINIRSMVFTLIRFKWITAIYKFSGKNIVISHSMGDLIHNRMFKNKG